MERSAVAPQFVLTETDVLRLLEDRSADSRSDITGKIAASYTGATLTDKERLIAEQIFRLLVRDTEEKVRATLAENLKESTHIPRDIVASMARDVAKVSLPILEYSKVLTDDDLLGIIHSTEENSKLIAISRRNNVSEIISDKLVEKGDGEVASSLVNNVGAVISEEVFKKMIERNEGNKNLVEAIKIREQLPVGVAEKLVNVVSSNISETLKEKYKSSDEQTNDWLGKEVEKEAEKTRESETLNLVRSARSQHDVDNLINHLQNADRLTPSMILSALCQGNFDFFESSLAKLSNISVDNARTLVSDRGDLGFRAIYNRSGLPDAMFPAVKLLLKIVREMDEEGEIIGTSQYANRVVESILQYSEENHVENLSYIIALVRKVA